MCYPLDVEIARDRHAERARTLEIENRLSLRMATDRPGSRRAGSETHR